MIARHQGIYSLGLLLTLGSFCGLFASLAVLPVILRMLPRPVAASTVPAAARSSSAA